MKKALVTIVLFLVAVLAFAQQPEMLVFTNERPIGRILDTQEEIKAKEYIFPITNRFQDPEKIYHSYIDTISKTITVQLRGVFDNGNWALWGKLIYYDLNTGRIRWTKDISYFDGGIEHFGSNIIYTKGGRSFCLNIFNGGDFWKANNEIFFVDPIANVGVGYRFKATKRNNNTLEGINLINGKRIWQREVNRDFGWDNAFKINDSEWMIASSGLHTVNIHNGLGWSYHTATGEKDYSGMIATNVAGLALGILTGAYMYRTGPDLLWNVVSNVYYDDTGFYLASKEKIVRINEYGEVIWQNPFSADFPSKSYLFASDDNIFMVNYGYASMNNRQIFYGTPFFAAYDKENGIQQFFSTINTTRNPILDFKVKDNHLLIVLRDRIMKYSISDGAQILEKSIDNNELGRLVGFAGSHLYIEASNSSLANMALSDISKNFIITSNNKVLIVDDELNVVGEIGTDKFYIAHYC